MSNVAGASSSKAPSFVAPFRHTAFTVIWTATLVSNVGSWMYSAASGWLMTSLNPGPLIVALVQAASTFPIFLLAMPAGALADIFDKRKYLIVVESLYTAISAVYAAMVGFGLATPGNLLLFTLLIGAAGALTAPAWQAVVPMLVPRDDLPAGIAANSVGVNISRARSVRRSAARSFPPSALSRRFGPMRSPISALSARSCGGARRESRDRCCRRSVSVRRSGPACAMLDIISICAAPWRGRSASFCSPAPIGRCCRWSPASRSRVARAFTACCSA